MDLSLTITLAITIASFTGIWLINVMTRDAGVIDYYWGPGFAIIGWVHYFFHRSGTIFELVFLLAVTLWAGRLAIYLIRRHHSSSGEDGRYLEMRESGGPSFWWTSYFKVFLLQAILLWIIATPVHMAVGTPPAEMPVLFWTGIAIFFAGFVVEWVADHQLEQGKKIVAPNELFIGGLWGRSRHPNYLGELILWWGLALAAFALSGSGVVFIGPAILTLIMNAVSLPLTEQHLERSRPDYGVYKETVPRLLPRLRNGGRKSQQPAQ